MRGTLEGRTSEALEEKQPARSMRMAGTLATLDWQRILEADLRVLRQLTEICSL